MASGEEEGVCRLVRSVFDEFVAPLYSRVGVETFHQYVDPERMAERVQRNHFVLVAETGGQLVGAVEVRNNNHISLFFVVADRQGQGIGRRLLREALLIAKADSPGLLAVDVHASPNAIGAYERLGFAALGPEKTERGMRYVPMALRRESAQGEQSPA